MPSIEIVRRAIREIEAEGLNPSIERIRQRSGGSPRDLLKIVRQLRQDEAVAPQNAVATPGPGRSAAPMLSLDDLRQAARLLLLDKLSVGDANVATYCREYLHVPCETWHVWTVLAARVEDPEERRVLAVYVDHLRYHRMWTVQDGDQRLLDGLFRRLVVDGLAPTTPAEEQRRCLDEFARLARQRRDAERQSNIRRETALKQLDDALLDAQQEVTGESHV